MNPRVSILVPVFNRADLLPECLESALAQTMSGLEVVVVDGASTDGTWDVCCEFAAQDERIRPVREESNSGPVAGWTRCLAEARGTYGTFLWSDDLLRPQFLESTLPFLLAADVGFAFTAAEIGPAPGAGAIHYSRETGRFASESFVAAALRYPGALPVSPACALFRLDDLRAAMTPVLPTTPPVDLGWTGAGTDLLLYLRTAQRYASVASVKEPLAFFRAHPGSISVQGRGGLVRLHYALARAWFATTRTDKRSVEECLARHWLSDMWARRRVVMPWSATRNYVGMVSAWTLVMASIRFVGTIVRNRRVALQW